MGGRPQHGGGTGWGKELGGFDTPAGWKVALEATPSCLFHRGKSLFISKANSANTASVKS